MLSPFRLSSETPWAMKSSLLQWQSLVDRTVENIVDTEGTAKWNSIQNVNACEFWTYNCTTELVRMVALVFIGATAMTLSMKLPKQVLIKALPGR
jgi:hypothetical protein